MGHKHEAEQWKDTGWCERCKQDEARPIYEVTTPHSAKATSRWNKVDYRYLCGACTKEFTKVAVEELCRAKAKRMAQVKEARAAKAV